MSVQDTNERRECPLYVPWSACGEHPHLPQSLTSVRGDRERMGGNFRGCVRRHSHVTPHRKRKNAPKWATARTGQRGHTDNFAVLPPHAATKLPRAYFLHFKTQSTPMYPALIITLFTFYTSQVERNYPRYIRATFQTALARSTQSYKCTQTRSKQSVEACNCYLLSQR